MSCNQNGTKKPRPPTKMRQQPRPNTGRLPCYSTDSESPAKPPTDMSIRQGNSAPGKSSAAPDHERIGPQSDTMPQCLSTWAGYLRPCRWPRLHTFKVPDGTLGAKDYCKNIYKLQLIYRLSAVMTRELVASKTLVSGLTGCLKGGADDSPGIPRLPRLLYCCT